jgi:hypothetical protein
MKYKEIGLKQASIKGINKVARIAYNGDVPKRAKAKPTPVVLTRFGKPYVIMQRYTEDVQNLDMLKEGKITWEDFREQLLQKGYEQMMAGETKVKPHDIVGAERVEVEKQRVKIEGSSFMLEAAKYFQGRLYICGHCGNTMLPATPEQEEKHLDAGPITDNKPETP